MSIQINKTRNEKGEITAETGEIQKNYHILLQKPIPDKTRKSRPNAWFSRHKPRTKVKSRSGELYNSPITTKEIEAIIKNLPTRWLYHRILLTCQRKVKANTLQTIQQTETEETLPNSLWGQSHPDT